MSPVFDAAPEWVDEMRQAIAGEVEKMRQRGPNEAELAKVLEECSRQTELALEDNRFWPRMIAAYDRKEQPLAELANYADTFKVLSPPLLHETARQYLGPRELSGSCICRPGTDLGASARAGAGSGAGVSMEGGSDYDTDLHTPSSGGPQGRNGRACRVAAEFCVIIKGRAQPLRLSDRARA